MNVLVASRNAKKLNELRDLLLSANVAGIEVIGLDQVADFPETPETGATFEENALVKARDGARETGIACLADDSGLVVDALNGMPGVLSARWSGRHGADEANNELLLAQLADVPDERRTARFVSACALVLPSGAEVVVRGEWAGRIVRESAGVNGFGYDPIFRPEGQSRTSAELSPSEKAASSHRGAALRQLLPTFVEMAEGACDEHVDGAQ